MGKQVLVPFDDSEQAHEALEYTFTEHPEDDLTVIHAIDPTEWGSIMPGSSGEENREGEARKQSNSIQSKAQTVADNYGVNITTTADSGSPSNVITQYANNNDMDHIIIGSHGHSGTKRLRLGSIAEEVARKASVPVTIIN